MRISFNNINFGNTFFLYPNKKNIEKTEKFSKRIERKSKTKIASVLAITCKIENAMEGNLAKKWERKG